MTLELLHTGLARALATIAAAGESADVPLADFIVERTRDRSQGDWSTNIALRNARLLHTDPTALAAEIADLLQVHAEVARAEASGPGFVNITVTTAARAAVAAEIVAAQSGAESEPGSESIDAAPETIRVLQAAHAAACRIERRATSAGIDSSDFAPETLAEPREVELLLALTDAADMMISASPIHDSQRLERSLEAVAEAFCDWSGATTVTPTIDEHITSTHASRLILDRAVITVLATGLRHLGASAPERM